MSGISKLLSVIIVLNFAECEVEYQGQTHLVLLERVVASFLDFVCTDNVE